jgi:GNAT superfamily N-acetyltransferase
MPISLRPCQPGDAAALALVGQATFLESYADDLPASDILHHCRVQHSEALYGEWLARTDYGLWLAETRRGRAPVGYAVVTPPDLPVALREGDLELKRIYLLHRFHGEGTGAALLRTAVEWARKSGAHRMLLGVYGRNEKAIGFYARQGFAQVGVRQFQVGDSLYDDLVLGLDL